MGISRTPLKHSSLVSPDPDFETIQSCRSCGSSNLVDILDLGLQPLANALVKDPKAVVKRFPLTTAFCPACSLFQLKETVRKEILFDRYVWVTGTSIAAKTYAPLFFNRVVKNAGLRPGDFVIEIASNDGTILKEFVKGGLKVMGVEPAGNIAEIAREAGVNTLNAYWNKETAQRVIHENGRPKVVMARNVIPHVSELHEVIESIHLALADEGVGIIEFHDGAVIMRELHYDSIYHEHLCYFTIHSITKLLNQYRLYPFHVDQSPISGGSLVVYFSKHKGRSDNSDFKSVIRENIDKSDDVESWLKFAKNSKNHREQTLEKIAAFKNKTIVGFGASARSSTYLNFCGLTGQNIKAIIDNNPLKQGLHTAGSNIPIVSKSQGLALGPDLIFILAWNFKDEIIHECQAAGFKGKFLVPFPEIPRIVETI